MLNGRQKQILDYVENYISKNGFSPTFQEIADGTGFPKDSVYSRVQQLSIKGHLSYIPGKQRTIRVVKHPEQEAV